MKPPTPAMKRVTDLDLCLHNELARVNQRLDKLEEKTAAISAVPVTGATQPTANPTFKREWITIDTPDTLQDKIVMVIVAIFIFATGFLLGRWV